MTGRRTARTLKAEGRVRLRAEAMVKRGSFSMLLFAASLAFAAVVAAQPGQAAERDAPCHRSMLEGSWELFNNTFGYALAICPVTIAEKGLLTTKGTCIGYGITFVSGPSGALDVDSSCHVTGSFSYAFKINSCEYKGEVTASLWLSADRSRISGYGQQTGGFNGQEGCTPGAIQNPAWIELVYKPHGHRR